MARPKKDLQQLARAHTESAVRTLVGIMNSSDAAPAARVKAAEVVLNRGWGMAKQIIDADITVNHIQEFFEQVAEKQGERRIH